MESSPKPYVCEDLVGQSLIPITPHHRPVTAKFVDDMSLSVQAQQPAPSLFNNFVVRPNPPSTAVQVASSRRHRRHTETLTGGIRATQTQIDAHHMLYHACADGSLAVVEAVLTSQNYRVDGLRGPIVCAAGRGFVSCVQRLVGCFQDSDCTLDEIMIEVALAAARTKNLEMMALAVEKVSEEGTGPFREWVLPAVVESPKLLNYLVSMNLKPSYETSAAVLNRAAAHGSVDTFRLLLDSGASMRHPDVVALHTAAASHEEGRIPVMEYLLDELGVDLEGLDRTDSESTAFSRHDICGTPLHYAMGNSQWVTANWLVGYGADPAAKNQFGMTPEDVFLNRLKS